MSERKVAILKKISLEGLADGWGSDCFIVVQPASYKQFKEYTQTDVEKLDEAAGIDLITKMIKEQYVSGQIMIIGDDGKPVNAPAEVDDIDSLGVEMLNTIFTGIMGVNYDPKATQTAATDKTLSSNSDSSIEN